MGIYSGWHSVMIFEDCDLPNEYPKFQSHFECKKSEYQPSSLPLLIHTQSLYRNEEKMYRLELSGRLHEVLER